MAEKRNPNQPDFESQVDEFDENETSESAMFLAKIKSLLNPFNILRFFIANLWKPVLTFVLLFFLFLAGSYAGGYYKLFSVQDALNFDSALATAKKENSFLAKNALPFLEWTVASLNAAGEMMQSDIRLRAETARKQAEEASAKKKEEELKAQESQIAQGDAAKKNSGGQSTAPTPAAPASPKTPDKKQEQLDLKKIAEEQQKELNKRAGKLATYYAGMKPQEAVDIMKNLENDEVITILNRMDDATAAKILALFDPGRAATISQNILKLRPSFGILPPSQQPSPALPATANISAGVPSDNIL